MEEKAYWETLPFWAHLKDAEQQYIKDNTFVRSYAAGEMIHAAETECLGMTIVQKGEVRTYILSEEGREITLFRLQEGDCCMLSASCVVDAITFDTLMCATKSSTLSIIRAAAFEKLAENNIYVRCFLYEILCKRLSAVMRVMQDILFKGYDHRLAQFLASEYDRTGKADLKMTHEQIAVHTNSAREVVARMLKRFAAEGYLTFKRGEIHLLQIEALRNI